RYRRTRVDGQEGIEVAAGGADGDAAGGRCRPGPPHGFAAGIAGVVRLTSFLGGVDIAAGCGRGRAADRRPVGEVVVGGARRRQGDTEGNIARYAAVTIDGDLVGGASDGVEGHQAGVGAAS